MTSIFGGLFGHDKKSDEAFRTPQLPAAPPVRGMPQDPNTMGAQAAAIQPQADLPAAPPQRPGAFDSDHYRDTMMALAAGFFSGNGLGEGLSNAAKTILAQNQAARRVNTPELGGPDDAFEVYTDPHTGERSYKAIPEFQDYLEHKRVKAKDTADMNGRVMHAIQQLPEDQRAPAYAHVLENPEQYGVEANSMPSSYDPTYGAIASDMGMSVSQALTRQRADDSAQDLADYRAGVSADRTRRTDIAADRAGAMTRQGDARIGIANSRLGLAQQANTRAATKANGSTIINGFEYRRDPVTGQTLKRRVQR